ncbi:MAG TPA: PASTA domain-containing protein, partial [Candidatus Hydrogenedentes bacterium]|nr:PASTA domain-containing protein [Candidatus Hydrogenedentota bacterium]
AMCLLPALEEVPDITGLDFAAAEAALQAAGFVVGTVTYDYSGAAPAGQIINQDPAAGLELPAGSTINLVVAAEPSIVPNVVGKTEAEAADLLAAAGLVVGSVSQVYSDTAPAGQVLQQSVAPGSSVAPGTAVNLVLSRGKETTVPAAGAVALVALSAALAGIGLARSRRK